MDAFTASRGEVRAVTDDRDPRRLLAARARARACSASRRRRPRWPACSSYGAEGRVVCVLTGHGLKDPQTAMNQRGVGGPLRARPRQRRAGGARREPAPRLVRVPASSANLGPGLRRAGRGAVDLTSSWRSRRPASSRVESDMPGRAARPLEPLRAGVRGAAPGRRADASAIRSEIPPAAGLGSSAAAIVAGLVRRRPHVRARRAAVRAGAPSSRATPTTWPRRCYGGFVICAGRRAGALRAAARAWRACSRSRRIRCRPPRRARRCPPRSRWPTRSQRRPRRRCSCSAWRADDLVADRRAGLSDRLHQPRRAVALPALDGAGRARAGARRGRRHDLGRRADRPVLVPLGADGRAGGALRQEAPDCEVRRVTFAPGGADVSEL